MGKVEANPCDGCLTKMSQASLYDEVDCYLVCKEWQEWRQKVANRREGEVREVQ